MKDILGHILLGSCVSRLVHHPVYFSGPTISLDSVKSAVDRLSRDNLITCYKKECHDTNMGVSLQFEGELNEAAINLLTRSNLPTALPPELAEVMESLQEAAIIVINHGGTVSFPGPIDARQKNTTTITETVIQQSVLNLQQTLIEQIEKSDKTDAEKSDSKSKVWAFFQDNIIGPLVKGAMETVVRAVTQAPA